MSNDSFIALIETVPLPMLVVGAEQRIIATNAPLRVMLGDVGDDRHFITVLRQPILVEAVEKCLSGGLPQDAQYLGRDRARDVVYDVAVRPFAGDVVLTFTDRTAAQEIGQLRRDFVANVSHELRTPLTALFGFIETLRGPARDDAPARDRFLEIMEREANRMIRLVDDLLSLSRVEEEGRLRPSEHIVLGDLVRTAIAELGPVIDTANMHLTLQDDSAAAALPLDPRQLRQVIGNLIENAIKYGVSGGKIDVNLTAPAYDNNLRCNAMTLVVQDHGAGIAPHHIPRLTERFYRVDDHRNREVGGTGLGLAIVKHIVNRHRGRMNIASTLGQGTTITVTLPVQ